MEIARPNYKKTRINTKPLSMGGRSAVPEAQVNDIGSDHHIRVTKLLEQGAVDLFNAWDKVEQNRIRQEIHEEKLKMDTHFLKQEALRDSNLNQISSKYLSPKNMEEDYLDDEYAYGKDKLSPYKMSEDISEDAKKQLEPAVKYGNEAFMIKSQTVFAKELVNRGKKMLETDRVNSLNSFNSSLTAMSRGDDLPKTFWKPNSNELAEKAAKDFEARLGEEIKHQTLRQSEADTLLMNFKRDLAGIIFARHLSQNPKEALDQIKKGFKQNISTPHQPDPMGKGDSKYGSKSGLSVRTIETYSVGGVSVDPSKVAKYLDTAISKEAENAERAERNSFNMSQKLFASQNPELFLQRFADFKKSPPPSSQNNQINLGETEDDIETERYVIKDGILENYPNYDPAKLQEHILIAWRGEDAINKKEKIRNFNNQMGDLELNISSKDLNIQRKHIRDNYTYVKGKGFRPKDSIINKISNKYDLNFDDVQTKMRDIIKPHTHKYWLTGNEVKLRPAQFNQIVNSVIKYHNTRMFSSGTAEIINPITDTENEVHLLYNSAHEEQKEKIDELITDFNLLHHDKETYLKMSPQKLNETREKWREKTIDKEGKRNDIYGAYEYADNNFFRPRQQSLINLPNATALSDIGLLEKVSKAGADPTEGLLSDEEKKNLFNHMKSLQLLNPYLKFNDFAWIHYAPKPAVDGARALHGYETFKTSKFDKEKLQ